MQGYVEKFHLGLNQMSHYVNKDGDREEFINYDLMA